MELSLISKSDSVRSISENPEQFDPSTIIFEVKQKNVRFDHKDCRMIIIRDVSELLKTEQAQAIQKVAEVMIATTSHDMRTPLNTTITMQQMIEKKIKETFRYDEELENWMRIAQSSARHL